MSQPQNEEVEGQMSLFGEGDHGDLTAEELPVVPPVEEPGGILIERDRAIYP
jgi:hypothetical protein